MTVSRLACFLACLALLVVPTLAQNCPTGTVVLSVTPATPAPGTPITVTVTGTPGAAVTMFRSSTLGQTTLTMPGPLNGTVICLAAPFMSWPLGPLPASGTKTIQYPTSPMAPANLVLNYQAVTVAAGQPTPTVVTSNTSTINFGSPTPPPPCSPGAVGLTITPNNPAPGTQIAVAVTGAPGAWVTLFRGATTGSAVLTMPGPLHNTVICLNAPFTTMPLGQLPPSGTKTVNLFIPHMAQVNSVTHYQAATVLPGQPAATIDTSLTFQVTIAPPPPPPPCNPNPAVILDIQPNGPVTPGITITKSLTGTPGAFAILAHSRNLGAAQLPNNLNLCLAQPVGFECLGIIPAGGTITRTYQVPPNAILPTNLTIYFQGVVVTHTGTTTTFDTSNTDTLTY